MIYKSWYMKSTNQPTNQLTNLVISLAWIVHLMIYKASVSADKFLLVDQHCHVGDIEERHSYFLKKSLPTKWCINKISMLQITWYAWKHDQTKSNQKKVLNIGQHSGIKQKTLPKKRKMLSFTNLCLVQHSNL